MLLQRPDPQVAQPFLWGVLLHDHGACAPCVSCHPVIVHCIRRRLPSVFKFALTVQAGSGSVCVTHAAFAKPPSLPQHLGPADVCSPPFSPPKASNLTAQRSGEVPGLSLASSRLHAQEDMVPVRHVLNLFLPHLLAISAAGLQGRSVHADQLHASPRSQSQVTCRE